MRLRNSGSCIPVILLVTSLILLLVVAGCSLVGPTQTPEPSPPPPENNAPAISDVTVEGRTATSASSKVFCTASDPDGDPLTYSWSSDGGQIFGEGKEITWIAPADDGVYTIEVTVTDGKGGVTSESVAVTISSIPNEPPVITELIVTPDGKFPIVVDETMEEIKVRRFSTVEIECKAHDPDGDTVSFTWSATLGLIRGEGSKVDYIANTAGNIAFVVTVTDSSGAETKKAVYFDVPCCGAGT